jgi:dUTP pyrophosphatase
MYALQGDSGFDLKAAERVECINGKMAMVRLGVSMEIPEGYEIQIRPKSGLSSKGIICMFGTIDSGYRGEFKAMVLNMGQNYMHIFEKGDKVCQGVLAPVSRATFIETEDLSTDTQRGENGFGSTGK